MPLLYGRCHHRPGSLSGKFGALWLQSLGPCQPNQPWYKVAWFITVDLKIFQCLRGLRINVSKSELNICSILWRNKMVLCYLHHYFILIRFIFQNHCCCGVISQNPSLCMKSCLSDNYFTRLQLKKSILAIAYPFFLEFSRLKLSCILKLAPVQL